MFMFISVFTANQIMIIISKDDYNIVKHLPGQFLSGTKEPQDTMHLALINKVYKFVFTFDF